jgi:hypothetical protein
MALAIVVSRSDVHWIRSEDLLFSPFVGFASFVVLPLRVDRESSEYHEQGEQGLATATYDAEGSVVIVELDGAVQTFHRPAPFCTGRPRMKPLRGLLGLRGPRVPG